MAPIDIHDYPKRLQAALVRVKDSDLSLANKTLLQQYAQALGLRGIGAPRIEKYVGTLRLIALATKADLATATRDQLEAFMVRLRARPELSVWTKNDYAITLHRFYKWLEGDDRKTPERVSGITATIKKKDQPRIKKAALLTPEDVQALIAATDHPRDRALIAMTWDTGARIGELGGMRISDLTIKDGETYLDLRGKTGARIVLAIESTPYLHSWLQYHPRPTDPEAPLWITHGNHPRQRGQPMPYDAFRATFQRAFKRAGIKKRYNPHLFRHSRATWCVEHGWTTFQLCRHFGWTLSSDMPSVYVSMDDASVHDRMRETYGLQARHPTTTSAPKRCTRCPAHNPATATRCTTCGTPLDTSAQAPGASEKAVAELLDDPRIKAVVEQVLRERLAGGAAAGHPTGHAPDHPGSAPQPPPPIPRRSPPTPASAAPPTPVACVAPS